MRINQQNVNFKARPVGELAEIFKVGITYAVSKGGNEKVEFEKYAKNIKESFPDCTLSFEGKNTSNYCYGSVYVNEPGRKKVVLTGLDPENHHKDSLEVLKRISDALDKFNSRKPEENAALFKKYFD